MSTLAARSPVPTRDGRSELTRAAPIVAAIDGSSASGQAVDAAVRLAVDLDADLTFVYVRRGPLGLLGTPFFQRRLTAKMAQARRVFDRALRVAARAGVGADAEILEGSPQKRIIEFADDRGARLVVVGSRKRKFGRSISSRIVRAANRPVVVARGGKDSRAEQTAWCRVDVSPHLGIADVLARLRPRPDVVEVRPRPCATQMAKATHEPQLRVRRARGGIR
jgi:nucleotide-binding universal stress UspA family protein